ncbi:MAG: hypothetical protein LBF88_06730 [Planctomycetaceae bacterium]|jgi:hypothetical protein|nr:hypothetical protein [Planctomycetaceae bacterium]
MIKIILLPFDLLGHVLSALGMFLWRLIGKFLLSPWGLIVPLTLLLTLFLFSQITRTTKQIAENYAKELEFCEESKIPVLVGQLVRLGENGIPSLVQGLCSSREPVFIFCRNTLQNEMERWEQLPTTERLRLYRLFSAVLLDKATQFGTTAQTETSLLARKILRNLVISSSGGLPDSRLVTRNCEQFLAIIETARTKTVIPNHSINTVNSIDSVNSNNTVASVNSIDSAERTVRFNRGGSDSVLMTAQGKPFQPDSSDDFQQKTNIAEQGDMLAVSRSERLYAYHQSPLFQKQFGTASQNIETKLRYGQPVPDQKIPDGNDATEMLASMTPSRYSVLPSVSAKLTEDLIVEPEGKIARNVHSPETTIPETRISKTKNSQTENFRNDFEKTDSVHQSELAVEFPAELDNFLPWELQELSLEKISKLSTVRLMRLLHHPDARYVSESRKTLMVRDGFQESHLKLAYRLFHPDSLVRMEILSMLPNTRGIRSDVWLSVLLTDPDNDIRYRAASFMATAGDPAMQRLVIDKGKRDSDARIVHLADQLLEQQRHRIRR